MSDRHEARLLVALLREDWGLARSLRDAAAPDPVRFTELARGCDIHPWVHALLERSGRFDLVGAEIEGRLATLRKKVRSDNLLLLARLEQTLDLLSREGIQPVMLKGADTLHRLCDRFDERTLDDVDLLVHPRDLNRTVQTLERAGFTLPPGMDRDHWMRSSFELPLVSPGPLGVLFEVHWNLGQKERYAIPVDEIIDSAKPLVIAERNVLRLDDSVAATHLLLHHLQHYFDRRLKWAVDLSRIAKTPEFTWERVARLAREWGGSAAAGGSLRHLARLFPDWIPEEATRRLPVALWRRALTAPLRSPHPLDEYRWTRKRSVQLYLAAVFLESPRDLPGYLRHRATRDSREGAGPTAHPPR